MATSAPPVPSSWLRWLVRIAITLVVLVALFAAAGYWLVPPIAKSKLEKFFEDELGRHATIGKLEFDPFTLKATLHDFALASRGGGKPLLTFETLDADISSASIRRWAPVFDAVRLVRPHVSLVRNADGTYDIQDLIERILAAPPGPPPLFAINNIEIDDGAFSLDDRVHHRTHEVAKLGIGIPFVSSLPYATEIRVKPRLEAVVNGSAFALSGETSSPFADTKEATLAVNLDALPLARYVEYSPAPLNAKVKDGVLTTRLKIAFVTQDGKPRTLQVSGTARIDRLALTRPDGTPFASAALIDMAIARIDALAKSVAIDRIAIDAPDVDLVRLSDGELEAVRLVMPRAAPAVPGPATPASAPWTATVAAAKIANGKLHLSDLSVDPPFRAALSGVTIDATKLATAAAPPAHVELSFDSDGARFSGGADVDIKALSAKGKFALSKFSLARLYPYYGHALELDVRRGGFDLAGDFDVAAGATPLQVRLTGGEATLNDVELAVRNERDVLWRLPQATLRGIAFDLAQHQVTIDTVEARQAAFRIVHESDGSINFARLMRTTAQTGIAAAATRPSDATWALLMRKITFDRGTADVEDRGVAPPVKLHFDDVRVTAQNFSNARGAKTSAEVRARAGPGGRIAIAGPLTTNPVSADWKIDATGLDLMPLKPYIESRTNIVITGGTLATKGRLAFDASSPDGGHASFSGDVTITDFGSLDRPSGQELVRWKSLALTAVDTTTAPPKVALGAIALDDFYARLIVNPDATLNLQRLLLPPDAASPPPPAPAPVAAAPKAAPATRSARVAARLAETAAPMAAGADAALSIGRIDIARGNVNFSDFFVRPNYSANLTDVAGHVSALSAAQAGDVEIDAKVERVAPVEIRGKVNPFARELTLDLTGQARDIDLPPLTPYAAKYAGYGIEKGKLSFNVHYRVEDRKLAADNKLVLDQLTFGARVDSPTATKLPVLLAVALLKDRNGVIDIELPISGSLDDPEFSVGGLIIRVIVNIITKIVTAPFALLGALAGGGGEQLAYIEFAPGLAQVSAAGETKLKALAKALTDRPALKLDVTGRAIPDADRDGLKRAKLDDAVRARKQKAQGASGAAATVEAAEYPQYLTYVYKDTDLPDKPKNAIGFNRDIPPAEMEALLLQSYSVDDETLRDLANRRAQTVKTWLAESGSVAPERMFLVAPKLTAEGVKDAGAPTRVDFSLK